MSQINPETAAHNIAKIFCENRYEEIYNKFEIQCATTRKGDPDVFTARELAKLYFYTYESAFSELQEQNKFSMELSMDSE
jgi:hypothetical protein